MNAKEASRSIPASDCFSSVSFVSSCEWSGNCLQDAGGSAVMGGREVMSVSEFESSDAVFKSRANKLASLLASGEENTRLWRPEELAAIFRHQMAAPIIVDLGNFDSPTGKRLIEEGEARGLLLKSF